MIDNVRETNVGYPKKLNHLSLCAGYGGIDLGLSRTIRGLRTVSYVEIEAFAIENLAAKVEKGWLDPAPIYSDLKTFPFKEFCGCIDLLSGGFPCQPFSGAGRKGGDEDPRHLFPYILAGAQSARIPILFLENVSGIISSKLKTDQWNDPIGTPVLLHVLRELERAGYRSTWGVFSAEEIGAPHQRKRVFILAVSNQLSTDGFNAISCRINDQLGDSQHSRLERQTTTRVQGEGVRRPTSRSSGEETGEPAYPLSHTARAALGDIDKQGRHSLGRHRESVQTERDTPECGSYSMLTASGETAYPRGRGGEQYSWEAPRVTGKPKTKIVGNTTGKRLEGGRGESKLVGRKRGDSKQEGLTESDRELGNTTGEGCKGHLSVQGDYPSQRREVEARFNADSSPPCGEIQGEIKPQMGRAVDGVAGGMGNAELFNACDNRTDELRLLGNGVIPDTATRAFRTLWRELEHSKDRAKG
tara:strand:- start:73 stop:1488 length:1416 start_codon:yes stop_codon:yes gene_type:complete